MKRDVAQTGQPETPAPAAPEVNWECSITSLEGGPLANATVGTKMLMKCSGPTAGQWKSTPYFVFPDPEQEFTLVIIDPKKTAENEAEWIVTGYKPGNHKPEWIDITDGNLRVRTQNVSWNFGSVVQAKPGEKVQPFPATPPVYIYWPLWVWLLIAVVLFSIGGIIYWRVRKARARKALLERLAAKGTVLTPYAEFHKALRQLTRRHPDQPIDYLRSLDQSFRYYLTREFLVPADEWPDRAVLGDLKKRHRMVYKSLGPELTGLLREFKRANAAQKVTVNDCEQLQEISRKVVDRIYAEKGAKP